MSFRVHRLRQCFALSPTACKATVEVWSPHLLTCIYLSFTPLVIRNTIIKVIVFILNFGPYISLLPWQHSGILERFLESTPMQVISLALGRLGREIAVKTPVPGYRAGISWKLPNFSIAWLHHNQEMLE